MKYFFVKLH